MRKKIPLHHTLRFKLIIAMVLIESIMLGILVWNNARLAEKALIEQTQIRVQDVLPLLNASVAGPLLQEDFARLNEIGEQVVSEHNVNYLQISNTTSDISLEFGAVKLQSNIQHPHTGFDLQHFKNHLSGSNPGKLYRFTEKIYLSGYQVGVMEIGYDTTTIIDVLSVSRRSGIVIASIEIFLSVILLLLVGLTLTRRLSELGDAAGKVADGDLSVRLPITGHDEVSQAATAFNLMAEKIEDDRLQLSESEQNLSLMLDSIGDAVIATDIEGKITRMNPIAEQLTGWLLVDAHGRLLEDIFPIIDERTRESIENPVSKVLATGDIITLSNHTTLIAKDGAEYQIADSAAPIRDEQGEIIGTILVFHDVSEQYRLRQAADESKERLSLHRDQTPLGAIEWNTHFEFVDWNPAAERIFGFKKEEVQGKHVTECILPESMREEINIIWQNLLHENGGSHNVNENITKDGRTILCEWFNTPLVDADGNVIGVASMVDDITERKQNELKLQQHQQNLEKMLSTMQVGIITIDERGLVLNMNPMAEAMFEFPADEVVGENISMLMPEPHKQKHDSYLSRYLETGEARVVGIERELFAQRKSGDLFPMRLSVAELLVSEGGARQFMGSCVDLTLQRQQEEQLRRTQKMDALGKLTGGIAHDYNNMLGVIIGYSELLQEGLAGDPKFSNYATEIQHAGQRGSKLTQKLLAFSRYKVAEAESVELNELLKDEQHMLEKTLTPRIKLVMDLTDDIWMIYLDSSDLEDTLLNISINAMHAMKSAGMLTMATRNEHLVPEAANSLGLTAGDYVILSITDTGSGMDKDIQSRIFDPFYTTKGDQGTGLGLSQVYSFMQRSKGAIHVYSEPGHGSRFSLYFPRFRQKDDFSSTHVPVDITNLQGNESILVVDDEQALRDLASEIFRTQGYRVLCAESGETALKILETEQVDLVLTDVIMQGMDGYQLAAAVAEKYPEIKIQLASGFNENRHKELVNDDLYRQALQKPYGTYALLKRVRELLD
jgi:PAS domain S-box-containing protein